MSEPVKAAWLGTAAVWVACGDTLLLVDGFFTRPPLRRMLFSRLQPDPALIRRDLRRAGLERLDAVLASHSHYDHALDAVEIANQTGAVLVGSSSLSVLARSANVSRDKIITVSPGDAHKFGSLRIEWLPSRHSRPDLAPGPIPSSIKLPAHALAYRSGSAFAIRIESDRGSLGIMGSAGYIPGMFDEHPLDALFLSAAGISRASPGAVERYFQETILASGARWIYPIHWDNFWAPIQEEAEDFPGILDNIRVTLTRMEDFCQSHTVGFQLPPFFHPFNPFSPEDNGKPNTV